MPCCEGIIQEEGTANQASPNYTLLIASNKQYSPEFSG